MKEIRGVVNLKRLNMRYYAAHADPQQIFFRFLTFCRRIGLFRLNLL
jgi:hypothetical protein